MKKNEPTQQYVNYPINDRFLEVLDFYDCTAYKLSKLTNISQSQVTHLRSYRNKVSDDLVSELLRVFPDVNKVWLLTGEGEMLKNNKKSETSNIRSEKKNLIPFYDNVATVGGRLDIVADVDTPDYIPTEYIDTGDWFREATAAIRHYGESMIEYPSGCILAIKEVKDKNLIIPGQDYMIETDEYRVTKRVQLGKDEEHFTAYSTNEETYVDGRLVHEPFPIPKKAIRHISLVLGYVVKKNGGTIVYNTNSKK